ncbi:MAG: hypothetical protein K9M10_02420 [Candidatus Pacebacteria bacterium]|nr:hypothetical protein [Candidatus Paceibacterota bacterium]MCF7857310.1 hypothetical protein [Candidatus Paceibacterota bacterium]
MESKHPNKKRGQGVVRISDLFKKYTQILKAPQGTVVNACINAIKTSLGVTVRKDQCRYSVSSRTLTLNVSGPVKSEVLLRKKQLLAEISAEVGEKSCPKEIL